MKEIDEEFWAWLTGFWEGEGSLSFHKRKGRKNSIDNRLSISQVSSRKPLDYIKKTLKVGNVYTTLRNGRKPEFSWEIAKRSIVIQILEKMLPHLRFRKEEVIEKLEKIKLLNRLRIII
jgi:hypothetical protein